MPPPPPERAARRDAGRALAAGRTAPRAAPSMVFPQGMAMAIAPIFLYNLDFGGAPAADAAPAKSTKLPSPPPEDSEPKTES